MAKLVTINAKLYVQGFDFSAKVNQAKLSHNAELKDSAVFGDTAKRRVAGLLDTALEYQGLDEYDVDNVDETLFGETGLINRVITLCPTTGADGERAYIFEASQASYAQGLTHGELATFNITAHGSGSILVRGTVLRSSTEIASGSGTAYQLGAVGATQSVYAALHVLAASVADTLDVIVQSDNAQGFPSPLTRLTFTQATAISAEWKSAAGAIADDWWRVSWTIGGFSPSFQFVVSVGIR